jgi:hypothetical protein
MTTNDLKPNFYIFGNKGNVWNNECHIAEAGSFSGTTLCGVPMLSTNWARIENVTNIGCEKCKEIYNKNMLTDFINWIKENKFCQYKDGTWYSLLERPYIDGSQRIYYKDEQLIQLFENNTKCGDTTIKNCNTQDA